jgi:HTH-type transcriptional regulator / antitoxin HigA
MGTLTEALDLRRYARLLAKAVPQVITTKAEHERALNLAESLLERGERNLSREEDALLDLLTQLIRDYEATVYPPHERSKPHEMLTFLLEQRGLRPSALWPVLQSKSHLSEILAGKRGISKTQAKRLAAFFGVSAALFL